MNRERAAWLVAAVLLVGGPDRRHARGAAAAPAAAAPYAWEDKFFVAPPRELIAAAKGADDPTASYIVLFEERVHTFDADGRDHSRYRYVYKILTETALNDEGISATWSPWHEAEPKIRARVVTRDAKAYVLDPKTIENTGVRASDPDVFTDRRQLRAPLPGLAVGAIVEEEIVLDSQPALPGLGTSSMFHLGGLVPVRKSRLVLEAARGVPLHVIERPSGAVRAARSETDGRVRMVYEVGPVAAAERADEGWPDDVPLVPQVRYATGPAWRDVATRYAELVDRQIAGADVAAWVKDARKAAAAGSRDALIAQLIARLHREVRYTGIEFGDASLVPRRPAEVLARGYGDCKDKAALLVALLRAASVPAHVALLNVGGLNVDAKLPSMDEFDHAIVYVPPAGGAPALWIDATNPYTTVGELPASDVNRQALVAAPRSDRLVTTPVAAAGLSTVRETCRVLLGETGHPRVIERTEAKGSAARGFRQAWSASSRKGLEEQFTTYVKDTYLAKSLARFDVGTPADLTKPLRLELEATDAEIGSAWSEGADVVVRAGSTLSRLPPALRGQKDDVARKPRTVDFVIAEPYVHELRYEIVPAHGYAADPLPAAETRAIGTASLRSSFSVDPRGVVIATFTFDSGKPRLTPAEFERFRADAKAFYASNAPTIQFHATGAAALAAGKVRDALAIFRKLDAEHPRQAVHARQISEAVLAAGLGQVARDEAKRALAVDPKSADGERVLGWALEHDLIGRRFMPGADLAGAQQAYRRALAIDPKHVLARASLAILLEHDATGQRRYPPAQLAEADKLYEALEKDGDKRFALNRTNVLLFLQRFKAVIERTRVPGASGPATAALLAAVAASEGAPSALRQAGSRLAGNDQRGEIMRQAGANLLQIRRYAEAAMFYEQAARDHDNGAALRMFAERLRLARRHETVKLDVKQPAQVARALLIQFFVAAADNRLPARSATSNLVTTEFADDLAASDPDSSLRAMTRQLAQTTGGLPILAVADVMAEVRFDVEGKPGVGYRARFSAAENSGARGFAVMMRADPEGPRVLGVGEDRVGMAREALRLHKAGRLDAARTWLDWLLEGESLGVATDPLSGSLFARVWSNDEAVRTANDIELAAAVALAESASAKVAAEVAPILQRAHAALAVMDSRRTPCALALAFTLQLAKRLPEADAVSAEVYKRHPRSLRALAVRLAVLNEAGRKAEALKLAEADAQARPNEPQAMRFVANAQLSLGRLTDAESTWTKLASSSRSTPADHNMVAWLRLCRGDVGDSTLASIRRAVDMSGRREPAILHTLASVLAERGEPEQAREALLESLTQRGRDELADDDRYVLGRIAEGLAFPAAARELYGKMKAPKSQEISSYMLAQRRLARLAGGGAPQAAGGVAKPAAR